MCALIPKHFRVVTIDINKTDISNSGCEILCITIIHNASASKLRLKFVLVYKPPIKLSSIVEQSRATALTKILHSHCDDTTVNIVLGDFNLPDIDWLSNDSKLDGIHDVVYNCFSTLGLSQFVIEPTSLNLNGEGNILDLVLCNDITALRVDEYLPPFGTSDHCMIHFSLFVPNDLISNSTVINVSDPQITLPVYDWSSGDYLSINSHLANLDWNNIFGYNFDADSIWDCFKSIIWPIVAIYVPTKFIPHDRKYKLRWYPKDIRKLLSRKLAIWRTLKRTHDPSLKLKYNEIANDCKLAILNYDKEREERILQSNNLGSFFRFVNQKLSSKSGIAPLLTPGGHLATTDLENAELLNEYFESAFTIDNGVNPTFPIPVLVPFVKASKTSRLTQQLSVSYSVNLNPTLLPVLTASLLYSLNRRHVN